MRCLLLIFLIVISTGLQAQKKIAPPGFEWVKSRKLLVGINEVSCADWLKFIVDNDKNASTLPQPNQLVNTCLYYRSEADVILRESNASFRDTTFVEGKAKKIRGIEKCANMPVTGVTYEQAFAYCDWLSEQYADSKYYNMKLNFRLPTPEEMDSLLTDIFAQYKKGDDIYNALGQGVNGHGCAIYNHLHNSWCEANIRLKNEFGYGVPVQAGIFFPDANGLYDLMGNVAEMTSDRGVAKGGSCISTAAECQPGIVTSYNGPESWLGFRVIAELKEVGN